MMMVFVVLMLIDVDDVIRTPAIILARILSVIKSNNAYIVAFYSGFGSGGWGVIIPALIIASNAYFFVILLYQYNKVNLDNN